MKVISGGQTGADVGGLIAGKLHGLETGGWMPRGYRAIDGNKPEYAGWFGVKEHSIYSYKERTHQNVVESDGTVRIAVDFTSPGEKCTLNAIKKCKKPYCDIQIPDNRHIEPWMVDKIFNFIEENNIQVLNVAGNSHMRWDGMRNYTISLLSYVFILFGFDRTNYELPRNFR